MAPVAAPFGMRIVQLELDCPAIIACIEEEDRWEASHVVGEGVVDYRTSASMFFPFNSYDNDPLIEDMNRKVYHALNQYAVDWDGDFNVVENISVQKYGPGDFFAEHEDDGPGLDRTISAVLYLNSVTGGETYFVHQDFAVKPKPGRLAIFPSNFIYRHEARPPKRGTKYAAAYWTRLLTSDGTIQ